MSKAPIRIANASGFYGDRQSAMLEVLHDGPVDVVTGDYLAELTMLILWKARRKDPSAGYARTFLTQLEQVLGIALDRGVKIVTNAGGLNPSGLAERVTELAAKLGLAPKVAWINGDDLAGRLPQLLADGHDLTHLDTGRALRGSGVKPLTANAYLGGWGITAALDAGADIVICPRVTDASLVTGPAAWWHGWARDDFDALAGAVVAGHVIECGPRRPAGTTPSRRRSRPPAAGYPIAEVAADGSSVITKHPGTGGVVSTGTVTAQLLYEIGAPAYHNPDVIAHFDTVTLAQEAPDLVSVRGARGTAPSGNLKVAINYAGGFRNTMTLVLTGLDIESKAASAQAQLFDALGGKDRFDEVDVRLLRFDRPDAPTNAQATAHLQITVKSRDRRIVGRQFSGAAVGLILGGYAGFHATTPPTDASEFGVYWPTLIPADVVTQRVSCPTAPAHHRPPPPRPRDGEEGASWSPGPAGATEERGSAGREADRAGRRPDRGVRGVVPPGAEEGASWSPGPAGATEERGSAGREADRAGRCPDRVRGSSPHKISHPRPPWPRLRRALGRQGRERERRPVDRDRRAVRVAARLPVD